MGAEESTNRRQGLTDREMNSLKANTNFSEAEIRENYDQFMRESPSGKMNQAQFRKYFQKFADPQDQNSGIADKTFHIFDQNGDGTITFSEFVMACGMMNRNDLNSQLELAFSMIDTSGDGSISFQEMVKFLEFAKRLTDETEDIDPKMVATVLFGMFDLDRSQKLSKKQFFEGIKNNKDLKEMFSGFTN